MRTSLDKEKKAFNKLKECVYDYCTDFNVLKKNEKKIIMMER